MAGNLHCNYCNFAPNSLHTATAVMTIFMKGPVVLVVVVNV